MGAAHSSEPRSVSMDNPTPAGVIDISDDVVNRLKTGISKQGKWLHSIVQSLTCFYLFRIDAIPLTLFTTNE